MEARTKTLLITGVAFVLGVLAGFFALFNVLFSDVFGVAERVWGVTYVLLVYLVLGGILGAFRPAGVWGPYLALTLPGALLAISYVISDGVTGIYPMGAIVAAFLGAAALPLVQHWRTRARAQPTAA